MLHELLIFALVFAASAVTLGPDTMTIFGRALSGGRLSAVPFVLGVVLAKLTLFTLVVLGLAALAQSFGQFFVILKFVGAAYLIWAELRTWRKSVASKAHKLETEVSWKDMMTGYALGVSNPQAITFYVALLPTVVNVQYLNLSTYLLLCTILAGLMVVIAAMYALSADRLRSLLHSPKVQQVTNRVAGGVMIGSGIAVATR